VFRQRSALSQPTRENRFAGLLKVIVSYDNSLATKWRRWLDREARAQDAETFRCKRKENE
jgi:hypothetical protein